MIVTETITIGERQFQRTASDTYKIRQIETGNIYEDAMDVMPCAYTYEETDIPLGDGGELTAEEALEIILGGTA